MAMGTGAPTKEPLGSWYNHTPALCSTGGATAAGVTPAAGSRYFLVVPPNGKVEGSYGRDSVGTERPAGLTGCRGQVIVLCP